MRPKQMPVFIRIDEYRELMDIMKVIRQKIEESKDLLDKIDALKAEEDKELASWHSKLKDVETRVSNVDGLLFEPEM